MAPQKHVFKRQEGTFYYDKPQSYWLGKKKLRRSEFHQYTVLRNHPSKSLTAIMLKCLQNFRTMPEENIHVLNNNYMASGYV